MSITTPTPARGWYSYRSRKVRGALVGSGLLAGLVLVAWSPMLVGGLLFGWLAADVRRHLVRVAA
ncbi:hypothetical protein [Actinopolymorpha sp. B9G3]|uniref:hypothetical protein n=1 Tax=Actinopolymorpha sp. B9G3 TaxID=3158970 RepID=UPI0032D8D4F1